MRLLIVKLSAIGDIVHTLPALAAIRRGFPDAEISWVVEQRAAEILRGNPMIDNLIEIDTRSLRGGKIIEEIMLDASQQLKAVRQFKYDIAIDFQGLLKSAMIARLSGAPRRWGFSRDILREPASRFLLTDTVAVQRDTHVIRKNLALAEGALAIESPWPDLEFPITTSAEHVNEAAQLAEQAGGGFAILNPGASWVTKLWAAEKYGELADRLWHDLGIASVLTTGPGEDGLAEKAATASRCGKLICSSPSLKGFFELARLASVYVGSDTGPTQIAVAARTPIVGLYGPTEWWRNGSPYADDMCVERNDIDCRVDCHRRTCDKWVCMDSDVDTVFGAVARRLENRAVDVDE